MATVLAEGRLEKRQGAMRLAPGMEYREEAGLPAQGLAKYTVS